MNNRMTTTIQVEVAYANSAKQVLKTLVVPHTYTVEQTILAADILDEFSEIDLTCNCIGIFGKKVTLTTRLTDGDRIEIYRPLQIDPKHARRLRAKNGKLKC
jgi:putative ubiquitin-RnfH superfamily antitoxin RatB of RatAB toxin-antitoxin module